MYAVTLESKTTCNRQLKMIIFKPDLLINTVSTKSTEQIFIQNEINIFIKGAPYL